MQSLMRKARVKLSQIAKDHIKYRNIIRWLMNFYRLLRYKFETLGIRVNDRIIIFSCFNGKNYSCSPKAIYEYIANDERFKDFIFIWAFKNKDEYCSYFEKYENTILVKRGSKQFRKYVAEAKYWFFNYKVDDYLKPKKKQVFIQCWHGTPLKMLGCDLKHFDNVLNTMEYMQKRYRIEAKKFDYFISPSRFATEKFISAWDLKKINKENIIIEEGYPRNDFLNNYTQKDIDIVKRMILGCNYSEYESRAKKKKIILYAPTYRSNQHVSGIGYTYDLKLNLQFLKQELGDDYIILIRLHYFISNEFNFNEYDGFIYNVSDIDDINFLYIISDILVTDYSSVFFDYANLRRPMIFYMYDLEHYRDKSNGFYIDIEKELPGNIVKSTEELVEEIKNVSDHFEYNEKYKAFNDKYTYLDDGRATERVVNRVFFS